MSNEIQIKGKKISELQSLNNEFTIQTIGDTAYLILSYKDPNTSIGQNFKISLKQLLNKLFNDIVESFPGIKNDELKDKFINLFESDDSLQNIFKDKFINLFESDESLQNIFIDFFTEFINNKTDINISDDVNIVTNINYIFGYASDNSDVFIKNENNEIISINIEKIKQLNYTIETNGIVPEISLTDTNNINSFNILNYNNDNNYSFIWDNSVINGNIWLIIPKHFFDLNTKSFLDNNNHKYKICDSLSKQPLKPAKEIIILTNQYQNQDYILYCFSTNGAVGKVYFKKIS